MRYDKHNVLVHIPHVQSLAALVLLTKKLAPRPAGYKTWLRYRKHLLRKMYRTKRTLECHYCGKGPLKIHTDYDNELATLDHVTPLSKGGERFHSSNLVVACYSCNSRKGNKSIQEFTNPIV